MIHIYIVMCVLQYIDTMYYLLYLLYFSKLYIVLFMIQATLIYNKPCLPTRPSFERLHESHIHSDVCVAIDTHNVY
jgi:hypothetical protein